MQHMINMLSLEQLIFVNLVNTSISIRNGTSMTSQFLRSDVPQDIFYAVSKLKQNLHNSEKCSLVLIQDAEVPL